MHTYFDFASPVFCVTDKGRDDVWPTEQLKMIVSPALGA
jgi:hypothetical protein